MGRPSAAERKPYDADTLTQIAFGLFRKHGYDATSLREIAEAAGITPAGIYYHVLGKEDILARGVGHALDRLFGILDSPKANEGPYLDRISFVLRSSVEIQVVSMDEVAVLLRLRGNTETEREALKRRREFDRRVIELVAAAMEQDEIRSDLAPGLVTRLLFGMANWLTEWYDPSGPVGATEMADVIVNVALDGLKPRVGGSGPVAPEPS